MFEEVKTVKISTKILIVLTALWMLLIFLMSAQAKEASSKASDTVTAAIVDMMYGEDKPKTAQDLGFEKSNEVLEKILDKGIVPKDDVFGRSKFTFKNDIRKIAHIFLYFVLAVLINTAFLSHFEKNKLVNIVISFAVCAVYAVLDELHQYFVPGRGMDLRDVAIDCFGVLTGIVFVAAVCGVIKLVKIAINKRKTA